MERPALMGTNGYTAPEQHLGERPTNRSDIYALGVIAYELFCGQLPYGKGFAGPRDVGRLSYTPVRQIRDDVPVWIDAALQKAVHKQPAERTDALSALTEDLRQANPSLGYDRPRPLLQRDPAAFWRLLALASVLLNVALVLYLMRPV